MEDKEEKVVPPPFPWKKGHNEDYSCFSLEVKVCQDKTGKVWSVHDFASQEDREIASSIYTEGLEQIVYSLFLEAVRREAFLEALIKESQKEGFFDRCRNPETKEEAQEELSESVLKVSKNLIDSLAEGAVLEIMSMLTND